MFVVRKASWLILIALLASCAPRQEIRIQPLLEVGSVLRFEFHAEVITKLEQAASSSVNSTLDGRVTLEIMEESPQGLLMQIRVEPTTSSRDGVETNPGPAEERTVLLRPDGGVISDPSAGGNIGDADIDPDALATLLRPRVPTEELRVGRTWAIDGVQGRLVSLAREDDQDLARLDLDGSRDVAIQRILDGQPIELFGIEHADTDMLWDLDGGKPASATIRSEASLEVRAGAQFGGLITIVARTRFQSA